MSSNGRRLIVGSSSRTAPFPTVETIKATLGIDAEDETKDAAIQLMLDASLGLLEDFCGRYFALDDYRERFGPNDSRLPYLLLSAYPVESVDSVWQDAGLEGESLVITVVGWKLFPTDGILRQMAPGACWCSTWEGIETIVDYRGGFAPDAWPADLVDILTRLFFDRWAASGGTGSLVSGSSGGGTGEIKSATVDGMRLDYDLGGAAYKGVVDAPPELLPYAAALARYRALDRALWGV